MLCYVHMYINYVYHSIYVYIVQGDQIGQKLVQAQESVLLAHT